MAQRLAVSGEARRPVREVADALLVADGDAAVRARAAAVDALAALGREERDDVVARREEPRRPARPPRRRPRPRGRARTACSRSDPRPRPRRDRCGRRRRRASRTSTSPALGSASSTSCTASGCPNSSSTAALTRTGRSYAAQPCGARYSVPRVRLLLLGGTKFLGRAAADEALRRGHELTLFNRGETNPELFPEAEHLHGDRDGGLEALRGRTWDAVIDPSGYVPRVVRASAELLRDAVEHYVFVSSVSVYRDFSRPGSTRAPRASSSRIRRWRRSWSTTAASRRCARTSSPTSSRGARRTCARD